MKNTLQNKHIVLGITGGIAAYKSAELVRLLVKAGAQVRVIMSRAAHEFVTPLTLQALSGHPVHQHLLDTHSESTMDHISLARWADLILVAPATAHTLARLNQGQADDLLTAVCLATTAPIALAPAMNHRMWLNQATQDNRQQLVNKGIHIWGPAEGEQACGESGPGRMFEPPQLLELCQQQFTSGELQDLRILITAGPTQEAIDPVRYISNHSSGKQGYALAIAAKEAGARVTLISGPVQLAAPDDVEVIKVISAQQMFDHVMQRIDDCDVFISTAAVADYRPAQNESQKIKKSSATIQLELVPNPDILAAVAAHKPRPFTIGFAAETENVEQHARAKLDNKKLDLIAANQVGNGLAFGQDDNALHLYWQGGGLALARANKYQLSRQLLQVIAERLKNRA